MSCPCGLDAALPDCCGRYHAGEPAPTAEALVRSRYAAFALGLADYLVETHDPETRGGLSARRIAESMRGVRWVGLTILATSRGGPDDVRGEVEFDARYRERDGAPAVMRERSTFRRVGDRWLYTGARKAEPVRRAAARSGPNDPCPCGSGRKHKRCCA